MKLLKSSRVGSQQMPRRLRFSVVRDQAKQGGGALPTFSALADHDRDVPAVGRSIAAIVGACTRAGEVDCLAIRKEQEGWQAAASRERAGFLQGHAKKAG